MITDTTDTNGTASGTDQQAKARGNSLVNELVAEREKDNKPVWIRAPKTGPEYWTGLSRAKLYELKDLGKIESRSIRKPGQIKGTRLFRLSSILDFVESCGEGSRQIIGGQVVQ